MRYEFARSNYLRFFLFALFHMFGAPAGARYLRPFLRLSFSVRLPPGVASLARNPEVLARARLVPCRVHPSEFPPATITSAPLPLAVGLRIATARGSTTPIETKREREQRVHGVGNVR